MKKKCDGCGRMIEKDESTYIVEYDDSFGVNEICESCSDRDIEKFSVLLYSQDWMDICCELYENRGRI